MNNTFAPGDTVATVGTGYTGTVISSAVTPRGSIRIEIEWTCHVPAAGIQKGERDIYVNTRRTTNLVKVAA